MGETKSDAYTIVVSYGFHGSIGSAPTKKTGGAASKRCGTSIDIDNRIYAQALTMVFRLLDSNVRGYRHLMP